MDEKQLRGSSYVEEKVSEYLYILTIFKFNESNEGTYVLNCKLAGNTNDVLLHISDRPSYPVLGPKSHDFNTTECIYVYGGSDVHCRTENGTEPVQVLLLIGHDLFVLSESEGEKGSYRLDNVYQKMAGLTRQNVTCQVSNSALETPYEVHGTLCNIDPPSDLSISVNTMHHYSNNVSVCFLNMSCKTDATIPPCIIEWSSDNDNVRYVRSINWTNGESGSFRYVSNVFFNVTKDVTGGTITCSTRCDHFPSHLSASYDISCSGSHPHDKINQTSRFPVNKVLIGTGVFCGLYILFIIGIGRCVLLKRRKVNAINTIEIVEHHRVTSADNGVLHIASEGVEYAVVQRQAATQGIETQQIHDVDGLAYCELDIDFLQEANARVSPRRKNTPTEYADIELSSTREPQTNVNLDQRPNDFF
ncbi:uncharacterized protein LOC128235716 [Mya arenaria]|uniref:uncharacterized protein LOC128235716 n=1 Tax=Mya arenaria TaxID=6604 RepID=UPI0022E0CE0E|nr:uncharacterized protein LOC128235716 [Mya arenaria]